MSRRLHGRTLAILGSAAAASSLLLTTVAPVSAIATNQPSIASTSTTQAASAAVPDTAALAGALSKQTLTWAKCDFSQASFSRPETQKILEDDPDTQCATVKVPKNWHDAQASETFDIKIALTKSPARGTKAYKGALLVNPGGPGGSGLPWGGAIKLRSPDLAKQYDLVGFDPRGVAASRNALSCPLPPEDPADPSTQFANFARDCANNPDVKLINTEQTTYDLDFIRYVLKQKKISYLGYSYGTWLGSWFGKNFGPHIDRMILDSSLDGNKRSLQHGWDGPQQVAKHRRVAEYLYAWMARNSSKINAKWDLDIPSTPEKVRKAVIRGFMQSPDGETVTLPDNLTWGNVVWLTNTMISALALSCEVTMGGQPADYARWAVVCFGDIIKRGAHSTLPVPAPELPTTWGSVDEQIQQRELVVSLLVFSLASGLTFDPRIKDVDAWSPPASPVSNPFGGGGGGPADSYDAFSAIRCSDGQWIQDPDYYKQQYLDLSLTAPYGTVVSDGGCATWKSPTAMPRFTKASAKNFPETIVLQGEYDTRTAYELGVKTATEFPNTTGIFIDNESRHGIFPYHDNCVDPLVYDFLLDGKRAEQNTVCQAMPLPLESRAIEVGGVIQRDGSKVTAGVKAKGNAVESLTKKERLGQRIIDDLRSSIEDETVTQGSDLEIAAAEARAAGIHFKGSLSPDHLTVANLLSQLAGS